MFDDLIHGPTWYIKYTVGIIILRITYNLDKYSYEISTQQEYSIIELKKKFCIEIVFF